MLGVDKESTIIYNLLAEFQKPSTELAELIMFLLTSGCVGSSARHCPACGRARLSLSRTHYGLRKTPFVTAMEFLAWKSVGEISRFASAIRTRGCTLWSSHELGRVSYRGAAGFTIGLLLPQRGAVVKDIYLIVFLTHELTRVS